MTMPLHPIRTYENRVELGSVAHWEEFDDLSGFKTPKSFVRVLGLEDVFGDSLMQRYRKRGEKAKADNKIIARSFGPRVHKNLPAAMYNTFIKSNFNYSSYFALRRTGRHWKKWDTHLVRKAVKHKEIIQQLEKDKAEHLIPACLHFEMDPSKVRSFVGRSAWKKIANNSKTRNQLIFSGDHHFYQELLDIRSNVLSKMGNRISPREIVAAKITPTSKDFHRTTRIVVDTFFMASELGKTVNPNWSYKRFLKEHDKLSRETLTKTYPDEPFCESHVEEIRGYTFCRLTSEFQIALEGKEMRHCVASYASAARAGRYEVYKVEGGRERATLGLYVDRMGKVFFDQMFGPRNTYVSYLIGTAAREFIVKEIEGEDTAGRRSGRLSRQGREDSCSFLDQFGEGGGELPF